MLAGKLLNLLVKPGGTTGHAAPAALIETSTKHFVILREAKDLVFAGITRFFGRFALSE